MIANRLPLIALLLLLSCRSSATPPEEDEPLAESPVSTEGMVEVPAGMFLFGTTEEEFQRYMETRTIDYPGIVERTRRTMVIPPESLSLPTFYIDRFEVTNEEFSAFLDATHYRPTAGDSFLKHWGGSKRYPEWSASFPVVWVSRQDAEAFCSWKGKRLPSEQEWEKAARGQAAGRFPWGDIRPSPDTANFGTGQAEPVGNRPGDRSPFGVYDLGGNVSELTSTMEEGQRGRRAVLRGGSFRAGAREMVTFSRRLTKGPDHRQEHVGFRCAADPTGPK